MNDLFMNRLNVAENNKQTYDNFKILNASDLVQVDLVEVEIEVIEFRLSDMIN